jgi:DNA replication ATP-dependent helicase Dna2
VLGALLKARSFVLVGDHYQLPPLVLDQRAAEGGLGVSLFRQLCEAHPGSVVVLAQQYRMCKRVMGLANELVYGGQLVAGSKAVEEAVLELPQPQGLQKVRWRCAGWCWCCSTWCWVALVGVATVCMVPLRG